MAQRKNFKSGLFLIEMIFAILFFSVASAVCVQLFAKAYLISEDSRNRTMAATFGQSAAECFKASEGSLRQVQQLLGGELDGGILTLYYDSRWDPVNEPAEEGFVLTLRLASEDGAPLRRAEVSVSAWGGEQNLFAIPAASYQAPDSAL